MQDIHSRMPAILLPEQRAAWLDREAADTKTIQSLLRPAPEGVLKAYPVSTRVNSPAYDAPDCITPRTP